MPVALLLLLAAAEPSPAEKARALDAQAQQHAKAGDLVAARSEWLQAFSLDPELPLPEGAPAEARAARDEALSNLKARLADAAGKATAAFTVTLPGATPPAPANAPVVAAPAPPPKADEPKAPEKERPFVAGGRLTIGAYGFYVIGESRGGPAPEISFGTNLGPVRLGGATALLLGDSLGFTLAMRVSTTSQNRIAFLAAADLGIFYGGARGIFAPFLTVHAAGLRLKTGPVGFEFHAVSLAIFWVGNAFRFVPQAGVALLL